MLNHVLKFKKYWYAASGQLRGTKFVPFKWTSNRGGLAPQLFFSSTMSYMFTRIKYQNLKDIWKLFIRLPPDLIKYLISPKPSNSHSLTPGGGGREGGVVGGLQYDLLQWNMCPLHILKFGSISASGSAFFLSFREKAANQRVNSSSLTGRRATLL